ncbi:MAG TPA: ribulokinase [Saprospiraceae bacterium]|nr:ribulokinase [Saprospiraceae bacterium]
MKYVIGLDFGTDSVRALVVDRQGREISTAVHFYSRWKKGLYCAPERSQFRQHPLDYLEGLEKAVRNALALAPEGVAENVVGISVDTTGSTPVAVDATGTPLSLLPEFAENPNGMFILWKDHTANAEAGEINALAHRWDTDFTKYVGGIYSSEWFWAKILRTLRVDEAVRNAAFSWVEHCDWVSSVLTGNTNPLTIRRSRCAAGHKAMWHEEFDGLPDEAFLTQLDPLLTGLRERLFRHTYTADMPMGTLSKDWAKRLGLSENVVIGVGAFDAHTGAVGAGIEPYSLVRVMGTSTCDMLIAPNEEVGHLLIRGICGQVDGSILPGMLGMEAGQSAFGDVYAWFQNLLAFPLLEFFPEEEAEKWVQKIIPVLSEKSAALPVSEHDPVALDWFNGRRTPDANHTLKGAVTGLNLGSDAPRIFKALVEATAFGAKKIVERFQSEGVPIRQVIGIGGVSKKSPFVMQTLANVLNMPIKIVQSEQACALGAAICAAAAAGVYPTLSAAQAAMASGYAAEFQPQADKTEVYEKLYRKYIELGSFVENGCEVPRQEN